MSLLVHELGHAFTAIYFGTPSEITLEAFGGRASYRTGSLSPKQEFLVVLNGPLLESLLIVLPFFLLKSGLFTSSPHFQFFLYATMKLNILWVALNLLPIAPLDGGHLARYLLEKRFGSRGYAISIAMGLTACAIAIPYLFIQGYFIFGILLVIFGLQNFQLLQKSSFKSDPHELLGRGRKAMDRGDLKGAKRLLKKLSQNQQGPVKHDAAEHLAQTLLLEGDREGAYHILIKANHNLSNSSKCVLAHLAFEQKNYLIIAELARDLYAIEPTYETALLNAKAFALLDQPAHSGGWLATALKFEDRDDTIDNLLLDPAFDSVKALDKFKESIDSVASI